MLIAWLQTSARLVNSGRWGRSVTGGTRTRTSAVNCVAVFGCCMASGPAGASRSSLVVVVLRCGVFTARHWQHGEDGGVSQRSSLALVAGLALAAAGAGIAYVLAGGPWAAAGALPVEQEAVAIRRELAATSPDRFRPDLARSLTSLAGILTALDRTSEADAARGGYEARSAT
jgi:hypothetical protein